MAQRVLDFLKTVPTQAWVIVCALVVALPLIAVLFNNNRKPLTREVAVAPVVTINEWEVMIAAPKGDDAIQAFNRVYPLGKTIFVPAGAGFIVTPQPKEIRGELEDDSATGTWRKNGGDTAGPLRAPTQPGLYHLRWNSNPSTMKSLVPAAANSVSTTTNTPSVGLDVLVLAESESTIKGEKTILKVGGKTIGTYLDPSKSTVKRVRENASQYKVPRFFATLTPEAAKIRLGPDFELGQLIAYMDDRDKDGHKIFTTNRHTDVLPLRIELIEKLIKLRERLRQKGVKITSFAVTSGFRTPDYNKQIGGVPFSRHCYGDAVDIYIDEKNDHHMDDLNGDGKFDRKDGEVIANACRELELEGAVVPGGIGVYEWGGDDSVRSHVHIDCRGFISRWGQSGSGKFKKTFRWWPAAEFQESENGE